VPSSATARFTVSNRTTSTAMDFAAPPSRLRACAVSLLEQPADEHATAAVTMATDTRIKMRPTSKGETVRVYDANAHDRGLVKDCLAKPYNAMRLRRRAFAITDSELIVIAAL